VTVAEYQWRAFVNIEIKLLIKLKIVGFSSRTYIHLISK
jgi:hypothetical protein